MAETLLPCLLCGRGFSIDTVGLDFFISTGICADCYRRGIKLPAGIWCFGKSDQYDAAAEECSRQCPDRRVCSAVVEQRLKL